MSPFVCHRRWINNDNIFIFGQNIPLTVDLKSFTCRLRRWFTSCECISVYLFLFMWDTAHMLWYKFISDFLLCVCVPVSQTELILSLLLHHVFIPEPLLSISMHMFVKILFVFFYLSLCIHHINFTFTLSCFCTHLHLGCFWQNCVNKPRSPPPSQTMNTQQQWQRERWRRNVAERNTSSRPVARSNTRHTTHCQSTWWLLKTAPLPLWLVLLALLYIISVLLCYCYQETLCRVQSCWVSRKLQTIMKNTILEVSILWLATSHLEEMFS